MHIATLQQLDPVDNQVNRVDESIDQRKCLALGFGDRSLSLFSTDTRRSASLSCCLKEHCYRFLFATNLFSRGMNIERVNIVETSNRIVFFVRR